MTMKLFTVGPEVTHHAGDGQCPECMWIIAGYALVFGALLCVTGLRLRGATPS